MTMPEGQLEGRRPWVPRFQRSPHGLILHTRAQSPPIDPQMLATGIGAFSDKIALITWGSPAK